MRLREAGRALSKDFRSDFVLVRSTKNGSSFRRVPMNVKLKALVETIRARRKLKPDDRRSESKGRKKTLRRACE